MSTVCHESLRYQPQTRKVWPWPSLLVEEVASWLTTLPGEVWLDAACGTGQLGKVVGERKHLLGLDIDGPCLWRAQPSHYQGFIQGSVTTLPLSEESLDGIASIETLEHIPDIDGALKEFSRCLKGKGYLLFTVPSVTLRSWWEMRRTNQAVYCDAQEHVREFSSVAIKGFPHRFETWEELETRLQRHRFIIRHRGGVGFLLPMWKGKWAWVEHGMNLFYRESVNQWLGRLPGLRKFPYYRLYVLQRQKQE